MTEPPTQLRDAIALVAAAGSGDLSVLAAEFRRLIAEAAGLPDPGPRTASAAGTSTPPTEWARLAADNPAAFAAAAALLVDECATRSATVCLLACELNGPDAPTLQDVALHLARTEAGS